MNPEQSHIEGDRDDDQTEKARKEVLEPQTLFRLVSTISSPRATRSERLTTVTFLLSPRRTHNWTIVKLPTQAMVNKPTHLTLTVAPRPRPVAASQNHQLGSKALDGPCSC